MSPKIIFQLLFFCVLLTSTSCNKELNLKGLVIKSIQVTFLSSTNGTNVYPTIDMGNTTNSSSDYAGLWATRVQNNTCFFDADNSIGFHERFLDADNEYTIGIFERKAGLGGAIPEDLLDKVSVKASNIYRRNSSSMIELELPEQQFRLTLDVQWIFS